MFLRGPGCSGKLRHVTLLPNKGSSKQEGEWGWQATGSEAHPATRGLCNLGQGVTALGLWFLIRAVDVLGPR